MYIYIFIKILYNIKLQNMSHRLEENVDTKNIDYKEPKTTTCYSTGKLDAEDRGGEEEEQKQTSPRTQTQDAEAV
jgi:hypothetical protein